MNNNVLLFSLLIALFALGLAACGGGDDDGGGSPFGPQDSADGGSGDAADDGNSSGDSGGNDSGGNLEDENCTFNVDLSGAVDAKIRWDVGCGGLASDESMSLGFTDSNEAVGLVFLIGVNGIDKGETGSDPTATISIIGELDDGTTIFHSTEEGDCIVEISSHKEKDSSFGVGIYVVKGRLTCTESAVGAFGGDEIEMGDVEFETEVAWTS